MMTKATAILSLGFAVAGCTKPGPVELRTDDENTLLEVFSIAPPDSDLAFPSIDSDSAALLPTDRQRFPGQLQIAHVVNDAGPQLRTEHAFTWVLFENRLFAVRDSGKIIGYMGLDLGLVSITSVNFQSIILPRLHLVGRHSLPAGFEYARRLIDGYQPGTVFTWRAITDSFGTISTSIVTPDDIIVDAPQGASLISRNRDLAMRWQGRGKLMIVISRRENMRSRPLFLIRLRENIGRTTLPRRFLETLPVGQYVFTFVLANRKENETVAGYQWPILVQASSVYNSYVRLQ
jgi:hypothetical protein